ncbi:MAG TPA: c-type cytochrome [Opitutaceae bacterium]
MTSAPPRALLLAAVLALPSALLLGLVFGEVRAQAPDAAVAAPAGTLAPGALVRFTSMASGATDVRSDRLIALSVAAGASPSALLPPSPFGAEWEASLEVPLRSDVTFSFAGAGKAQLFVNDQPVLEEMSADLGATTSATVRLAKGPNRVRVVYASPESGDATFSLRWQGRGFNREGVPPMALSHDPAAAGLARANLIREGRELVANLHCLRCHDAGDLAASAAMPELQLGPPYLGAAGERFQADWLAAWIADPHALRPGTRMPKLALTATEIADITAYLVADAPPTPATLPAADAGLINRGAHLFTDLQCVSCHALPGRPADVAGLTRVSLAQVPVKWRPAALQEYLREPEALHAGSRMPNFKLSEPEAQALAAFLLAQETPVRVAAAAKGDPIRGQDTFVAKSCLNCHAPAGPVRAQEFAATIAGGWTRGCVADDAAARGTAPDFAFTPAQIAALRAFAAAGVGALTHDVPVEFANRQWADLRCAACHARDGEGAAFAGLAEEIAALEAAHPGRPPADEGEESSVDPHPPLLTWAGEKLKPEWMTKLFGGELFYRARPWLAARMPAFPARAAALATGLAAQHGAPSVTPAETAGTAEQIAAGQHLAGTEAFNCLACHAVGETPATAPFGAPGVNFAHVAERIRPEYFVRWMDNPLRVVPGTKMPKFTDAAGRTTNADVLDGDTRAQWDALYAYLRTLSSTAQP